MSTVIKSGDKNILYVKGASEIVLEGCNQLIGFDGKVKDIDKNLSDEIHKAIEDMAV
jgi:magnesium-transporting ATPase (P-type)